MKISSRVPPPQTSPLWLMLGGVAPEQEKRRRGHPTWMRGICVGELQYQFAEDNH